MSYLWAVGAGLGVIGSVFSNLGVNVQKYSFMKTALLVAEKRKPYWKTGGWWLGLALVILGAIGDFVALGLAAQSIVAPIGAMTLVANVFFAHYWLKEHLPRKDLFATVSIVAGSVLCAVMGDHTETTYSLEQLLSFYGQAGFIVYAIFVFIFVCVLYALAKHIEPIKRRLNVAVCAYEQAKAAGPPSALPALDENILAAEAAYTKWEKIHPFSYCAISGAFGGQNILFGKMVAELLARTFSGDNQMKFVLTYVFVICMLTSIFFQLHFLAKALSSFDALYCVPVFQCFFIVFSTLAGAAYFSEFSRFNLTQSLVFPLGFVLTLGGVYILSSRKMREKHDRLIPEPETPSGITRRKSNYASGKPGLSHFHPVDPALEILAFERVVTPIPAVQIPQLLARVVSLGHAGYLDPCESGFEAASAPAPPESIAESTAEFPIESTMSDSRPSELGRESEAELGGPIAETPCEHAKRSPPCEFGQESEAEQGKESCDHSKPPEIT